MTEETTINALRLNVKLERITNEELTEIYNIANGLDNKRHNPITTERIFSAMRAAMIIERESCIKACEGQADVGDCDAAIRSRSN